MGSWNGICELSNLPIEEGDEVIVIPVAKNKLKMENTLAYYPFDNFWLLAFPFRGIYDGYGSIKNEGIKIDHVNKYLLFKDHTYCDSKSNLFKCEDIPEMIRQANKNYSWLYLCEDFDANHMPNTKLKVEFVMIHSSIYDSLVSFFLKRNKSFKNDFYKRLEYEWNHDYLWSFSFVCENYISFNFVHGKYNSLYRDITQPMTHKRYCFDKAYQIYTLKEIFRLLNRGMRCISGKGNPDTYYILYQKFLKIIEKFIKPRVQHEKECEKE